MRFEGVYGLESAWFGWNFETGFEWRWFNGGAMVKRSHGRTMVVEVRGWRWL